MTFNGKCFGVALFVAVSISTSTAYAYVKGECRFSPSRELYQIDEADVDENMARAAIATFIWGLSNRNAGAVWLLTSPSEQKRFGSEDAAYSFFSRVSPPLANAKDFTFDSAIPKDGDLFAYAYVTDTAELQWFAMFILKQDGCGALKVVGVRVLPAPGDLT